MNYLKALFLFTLSFLLGCEEKIGYLNVFLPVGDTQRHWVIKAVSGNKNVIYVSGDIRGVILTDLDHKIEPGKVLYEHTYELEITDKIIHDRKYYIIKCPKGLLRQTPCASLDDAWSNAQEAAVEMLGIQVTQALDHSRSSSVKIVSPPELVAD